VFTTNVTVTTITGSTANTVTIASNVTTFQSNGAATVMTLANGNVGIGTTSPGYAFTLTGTPANLSGRMLEVNTNMGGTAGTGECVSRMYFTDSGVTECGIRVGVKNVSNPGNLSYPLQVYQNGTAVMSVTTSGNVGIGTTSPGYKLETSGGAIAVTGTNDYLYYAVTNSTASGCYMMFDAQTAGGSGRKYQIGSTGTSNNPGTGCFELFDATAAATRLVVNASGNVGIGTTSPGAALDVYSNQATARMARFNNTKNDGGSQDTCFIHTDQPFNNAVWSGSALTVTTYPSNGTNNSGYIAKFGTSDSAGGSMDPKVVISSAYNKVGFVGIGTTSPATTLDVNGTIRTAGNQGTNALILYFLSTPFTQQVSYVNTVDTSLTFSATYIPAAARAVMADVFWSPGLVGGTTVDHQIMNLGSVSNGVQRTWTDGGWGSNPSSYLGTMNNQIVRLLSDGENGGGTAYFIGLRGIWFASKTIPIAANGVMYYSNYGNSNSSGYLYFVVKGYYM
jgi:hypothetical protein